jgi:hypothetical protein
MGPFWKAASLAGALAALAACSGGGGGDENRSVPAPKGLSWTANRERGVNAPGGGYLVAISGRGTVDVPYVSGLLAPTVITTTLPTGNYTITVRAYAALDVSGGTTGTVSAPSQTLTVNVP